MIGSSYWSPGITVVHTYSGGGKDGWAATLEYLDGGFCNDEPDRGIVSTEGTLCTRYCVKDGSCPDPLGTAIDVLKADAERMGIAWREPCLYYRGDGGNPDYPPPAGWLDLLQAQAGRIGWHTYASANYER